MGHGDFLRKDCGLFGFVLSQVSKARPFDCAQEQALGHPFLCWAHPAGMGRPFWCGGMRFKAMNAFVVAAYAPYLVQDGARRMEWDKSNMTSVIRDLLLNARVREPSRYDDRIQPCTGKKEQRRGRI